MPLDLLALLVGNHAPQLRQFANGIDERPLLPASEPQKSFSKQETFNEDVTDEEYVEAIQQDISWMGYEWGDRLYFGSDYSEQIYEYAVKFIRKGLAYVDDLSVEQIRDYRGTLTEPGRESPWRTRGVDENLNAPCASYVPLAFEQSTHLPQPGIKPGASAPNRFYMYGVVARLAMLAASYELEATDPNAEVYD